MSWSLQVQGGDISYGATGLNTATGGTKLTQDLACCLLEPMGTDPLHPTFGSVLDGGIGPDGTPQQGYIGLDNDSSTSLLVSTEIRRIVQDYQTQQLARTNADVATYGKSTLSASEAVVSVNDITLTAVEDSLMVTVDLDTGAGVVTISTIVGS